MYKNFEYLVGNGSISKYTTQPFSNIVCDFLCDLSKVLITKDNSKKYPDIITFAFWCRKKNIEKLKKNFMSDDFRLSLGLVFHITPSNIPTNFAYSLAFGLITGNSNIIKVPSKNFEQVKIICKAINKLIKKKHKLIKKMISIVRYSENEEYTKKISSFCNARLIWGGDISIKNIRKYSLQERALDIAFADRYSFCIINTLEILKLNELELKRLTEKFYNDTYLVDQNACSSPHLIVWLGKESEKARVKFWNSLEKCVEKKYNLTENASIDKYTKLCSNILGLKNIKKHRIYNNSIYTVLLKKLDKDNHKLKGKWGFFYECNVANLSKIKNFINNKYQTLTYFGLNKNFFRDFVTQNQLQGIDRIVPIGQALDISFLWDGYDISKTLTRIVDIK